MNLRRDIKKIKSSIVAVGFIPSPNRMTIVGSGFAVSDDGKILSAAHIYNQLKPENIPNLMASVLTEEGPNGFEGFKWLPLKLLRKEDKDDMVLFQIEDHKDTLLTKLELGDSEEIEVGDEVYFVGFPYAGQLINDGFGVTRIVNRGIISNVKRDGVDPRHQRNFLFVDAISNPGNSGCPLISLEDNKAIGVMSITFHAKSRKYPDLDIKEPMHICAARPINLAKPLLRNG